MLTIGYSKNEYDSCQYIEVFDNCACMYLLLYVDNILTAIKGMSELSKLKSELSKEFDMKDLGEARKILGIKIK